MGNCFVCFKAPSTTGLDNNSQFNNREDMPEAHLYPAPSHIPASAAPQETLLSNGNHHHLHHHHHHHLQHTTGHHQHPAAAAAAAHNTAHPHHHTQHHHLPHGGVSGEATVTGTTTTAAGGTGGTTGGTGGSGGGTTISRFYQYSRRAGSKSAPAMGAGDSRQSDARLNALFEVYKDEREDAILAEGIEQLCKDLQVSPDDFRILVLAWRLNAEQMCRFTRAEFVEGLRGMRADTVKTVGQRLPDLVAEVEASADQFKDLYRFTFKFGLDGSCGQRILPLDMAVVLWRLVFTVREPPILRRWLRYLETHDGVIRGIPRDTWNMFLNFSETVGDDLSSYDDAEAWPSLFDDFVEHENDQANQNVVKDKDGVDELIRQRRQEAE